MISKIIGFWLVIDAVGSIIMDLQKYKYSLLAHSVRILRCFIGCVVVVLL